MVASTEYLWRANKMTSSPISKCNLAPSRGRIVRSNASEFDDMDTVVLFALPEKVFARSIIARPSAIYNPVAILGIQVPQKIVD